MLVDTDAVVRTEMGRPVFPICSRSTLAVGEERKESVLDRFINIALYHVTSPWRLNENHKHSVDRTTKRGQGYNSASVYRDDGREERRNEASSS